MAIEKWADNSGIAFDEYDLEEDISSSCWIYLHNDLKQAYADHRGWIEEYWDENDDMLYEAEEAAYQVIAEIREEHGWL